MLRVLCFSSHERMIQPTHPDKRVLTCKHYWIDETSDNVYKYTILSDTTLLLLVFRFGVKTHNSVKKQTAYLSWFNEARVGSAESVRLLRHDVTASCARVYVCCVMTSPPRAHNEAQFTRATYIIRLPILREPRPVDDYYVGCCYVNTEGTVHGCSTLGQRGSPGETCQSMYPVLGLHHLCGKIIPVHDISWGEGDTLYDSVLTQGCMKLRVCVCIEQRVTGRGIDLDSYIQWCCAFYSNNK